MGRRISFDDGKDWTEIVGVTGDVRERELNQTAEGLIYVPYAQYPQMAPSLVARTQGDPMNIARTAVQHLYEVDPNQPAGKIQSLEQVRAESIAAPRLTTNLLGLFALLALAIAAAGIGGVMALSVSQRISRNRCSHGDRSATDGNRLMILRQGMGLALVGVVVGVLGAFALTQSVRSVAVWSDADRSGYVCRGRRWCCRRRLAPLATFRRAGRRGSIHCRRCAPNRRRRFRASASNPVQDTFGELPCRLRWKAYSPDRALADQRDFRDQRAQQNLWLERQCRVHGIETHAAIPVLLAAALVIEGLGSLCLITGFAARAAATVMFLYLIPVTFLLHEFMSTNFQKNLGIMGGLLMIAAYGPGRLALAARRSPSAADEPAERSVR